MSNALATAHLLNASAQLYLSTQILLVELRFHLAVTNSPHSCFAQPQTSHITFEVALRGLIFKDNYIKGLIQSQA
jgi:hypothetical protein